MKLLNYVYTWSQRTLQQCVGVAVHICVEIFRFFFISVVRQRSGLQGTSLFSSIIGILKSVRVHFAPGSNGRSFPLEYS